MVDVPSESFLRCRYRWEHENGNSPILAIFGRTVTPQASATASATARVSAMPAPASGSGQVSVSVLLGWLPVPAPQDLRHVWSTGEWLASRNSSQLYHPSFENAASEPPTRCRKHCSSRVAGHEPSSMAGISAHKGSGRTAAVENRLAAVTAVGSSGQQWAATRCSQWLPWLQRACGWAPIGCRTGLDARPIVRLSRTAELARRIAVSVRAAAAVDKPGSIVNFGMPKRRFSPRVAFLAPNLSEALRFRRSARPGRLGWFPTPSQAMPCQGRRSPLTHPPLQFQPFHTPKYYGPCLMSKKVDEAGFASSWDNKTRCSEEKAWPCSKFVCSTLIGAWCKPQIGGQQ
ncbi:hypothetical protein BGZ57DRAFT_851020 [Hyaloscypha finlandica]|nr:hypothetical protein BGZ57DRAFT_851020 [Hyaloscypha finlandica]